jgi:hypothetical protein
MRDLPRKMNVSILDGRTRTIKSRCKEEEEEDPNPRKKKVMIHNPRKKHNIDGAICYRLHHKTTSKRNTNCIIDELHRTFVEGTT